MIWGTSATPQLITLANPKPKETPSLTLQRQYSMYILAHSAQCKLLGHTATSLLNNPIIQSKNLSPSIYKRRKSVTYLRINKSILVCQYVVGLDDENECMSMTKERIKTALIVLLTFYGQKRKTNMLVTKKGGSRKIQRESNLFFLEDHCHLKW